MPTALVTGGSGSSGGDLTSTTHVDNCGEGLVLAATRGTPGSAYFVTDGAPVVFREFVTALLATRGVVPPNGRIPTRVALGGARAAEAAWRAPAARRAAPDRHLVRLDRARAGPGRCDRVLRGEVRTLAP